MSSYISRILQAFSVSKHVVIGTAIIESKFSEGQINSVNHFKKYHASLFGLFYKFQINGKALLQEFKLFWDQNWKKIHTATARSLTVLLQKHYKNHPPLDY